METHWTILPPGNIGINTEPVTASDKTESLLRALIFSGQLGPGDKLPSERELALQLSTSRPTLRTALRALEALGFVVVRIGSKGGFWISDAETISRRWRDWMHANHHRLEEMLEFRRWVELEVVRQAAMKRTPEDIEILQASCEPPEPTRTALVRWFFGLNDALAAAAHNRYLENAMATIRGDLFAPVDLRPVAERAVLIPAMHRPLIEAICEGEPDRAVELRSRMLDEADRPFRE